MKITKILGALLAVVTLGTTIALTPDISAQAKAQYSLKSVPKKFRGTRYSYSKAPGMSQKAYTKVVIGAKKFAFYYSDRPMYNYSSKVKSLNLSRNLTNHNFNREDNSGTRFDAIYVKKGTLYDFDWLYYWKDKKSEHTRYTLINKTYNGKRIKVLHEVDVYIKNSRDPAVTRSFNQVTNYYPTKAQAKYFGSK